MLARSWAVGGGGLSGISGDKLRRGDLGPRAGDKTLIELARRGGATPLTEWSEFMDAFLSKLGVADREGGRSDAEADAEDAWSGLRMPLLGRGVLDDRTGGRGCECCWLFGLRAGGREERRPDLADEGETEGDGIGVVSDVEAKGVGVGEVEEVMERCWRDWAKSPSAAIVSPAPSLGSLDSLPSFFTCRGIGSATVYGLADGGAVT